MANIASIVKYEGDNSTFIWKHPLEDFNSTTQLIVHESQEAVFFMNGQALDSFGPGRFTLETQNIPLIRGFFSRATGDKSPFHCEVYFINKTEQMAIKWGTDSKMEYVEPTYGFPIQLGASGEMNLRLENGRKLLIKVVGTENGIAQVSLVQKMRTFLMTRVKPYIVTLIRENKINIFQIDEYLQSMSQALLKSLTPDFAEYGVSLEHFFVTTILKPEDDKSYIRFKEIHFRQFADVAEAKIRQQVGVIEQQTAAQKLVIEAEAIARKRSVEGFTYQEERGFSVAERMAANEAVGQLTNMGIGMGMISGIGGTVGNTVGGMMQNTLGQSMKNPQAPQSGSAPLEVHCAKCSCKLPSGAKFCLECGEKAVPPTTDTDTTCPNCSSKVPKGRFCPGCGAPLSMKCPSCGKDASVGAKFCLECGTKLNRS